MIIKKAGLTPKQFQGLLGFIYGPDNVVKLDIVSPLLVAEIEENIRFLATDGRVHMNCLTDSKNFGNGSYGLVMFARSSRSLGEIGGPVQLLSVKFSGNTIPSGDVYMVELDICDRVCLAAESIWPNSEAPKEFSVEKECPVLYSCLARARSFDVSGYWCAKAIEAMS